MLSLAGSSSQKGQFCYLASRTCGSTSRMTHSCHRFQDIFGSFFQGKIECWRLTVHTSDLGSCRAAYFMKPDYFNKLFIFLTFVHSVFCYIFLLQSKCRMEQ